MVRCSNNLPRWVYLNICRRIHRRIAWGWLNQRAVDGYTASLDREATVLIKALYDESESGLVPVNPQVCIGEVI